MDVPLDQIAIGSRESASTPFTVTLSDGRSVVGTIRGETFEGKGMVQGFRATVREPIEDIKSFRLRKGSGAGISATLVRFAAAAVDYDEFGWVRPDRPFDCGVQTSDVFRLSVQPNTTLEVPEKQIVSFRACSPSQLKSLRRVGQ